MKQCRRREAARCALETSCGVAARCRRQGHRAAGDGEAPGEPGEENRSACIAALRHAHMHTRLHTLARWQGITKASSSGRALHRTGERCPWEGAPRTSSSPSQPKRSAQGKKKRARRARSASPSGHVGSWSTRPRRSIVGIVAIVGTRQGLSPSFRMLHVVLHRAAPRWNGNDGRGRLRVQLLGGKGMRPAVVMATAGWQWHCRHRRRIPAEGRRGVLTSPPGSRSQSHSVHALALHCQVPGRGAARA